MSILTDYDAYPLKKILVVDLMRLMSNKEEIVITEEGDDTHNLFEGRCEDLEWTKDGEPHELCSRIVRSVEQLSTGATWIQLKVVTNNMEYEKYKQMPTIRDIMRICTGDEIIEVRYRDQKLLDPAELTIEIDGEQPNYNMRNNVVIGDYSLIDMDIKEDSLWTYISDEEELPYTKILIWIDREEKK